MENKEKYIPLTKVQKSSIENYLQSRLGIYGVKSYEFEWEETPSNSFKEMATQKIELEHIGIMKFMISKITLRLTIWGNESNKEGYVEFSYEHPNGGSNGHDSTIKLNILSSGNIYEVQK